MNGEERRDAPHLMQRAGALLASAFGLLPRSLRFRAMVLLAWAIEPLVRRTAAFRLQQTITTDSRVEIALWFIANALTVRGVEFDPVLEFEGLEHLIRLDREGRGVLLIQPHSAMTHLSFRAQFDAGLNTVAMNNAPGMHYAGTRIYADPVLPGPTFLVRLRNRLREGRLICGAIDRGEHEEERTVEIATRDGRVIIAPALIRITRDCGGRVAFTRCWLEGLRVRAEVVLPAEGDVEEVTRAYADYIANHRIEQAERARPGLMRRILRAAAVVHIALALLIFAAARSHVAPALIDASGIIDGVGVDSHTYKTEATALVSTMRTYGFSAWIHATARPHVRLLSLLFAVFGAVAGQSTLAAEPFNLFCYLVVVVLAFAIAREGGGERVGGVAACCVALWPTFLLHTTQFLKDPLFVAGVLALVFVIVTWLTREYSRLASVMATAFLLAGVLLVVAIRAQFAVAVAAMAATGVGLLAARQIAARRLLRWNLFSAVITLAAVAVLLGFGPRTIEKAKPWPPLARGESKAAATGVLVPSTIVWRTSPATFDDAAATLGSARERYNSSNAGNASGIDDTFEINGTAALAGYLPRAAAIGLWAPFPRMWAGAGQAVGRIGRLIAGAETLAMYVFELLAICAVVLPGRRLAALFLVLVSAFGVTGLALVVSNVGTLYRFRYSFWILMMIAGVCGAQKLRAAALPHRRLAAVAVAIFTLSCSARPASGHRVRIKNSSGVRVTAIYASPHDSGFWEENVLGGDHLADGQSVVVRFEPRRGVSRWDVRADGQGFRAEWKDLDLDRISSIRLRVAPGKAIADVVPAGRR